VKFFILYGRTTLQFKEYLKLHEVGEEFFSPNGVLARLGGDQSDPFLGSFFEPYQAELRYSSLKVQVSQIIKPGLLVKFSEKFKPQSSGLLNVFLRFIKTISNQPVFDGYIEENTGSKLKSQFPFGVFLKVRVVQGFWAQYEEQDGTIWQVSHEALCYIGWIEVVPDPSADVPPSNPTNP